jgi:antirestriction protein ArdC
MRPGRETEQPSFREFDAHATIDQGVQSLLFELSQGKSEHLEQYLAFSARFHRYSLHNQLLIYMQCPQASHVAGYRTWQDMGYQVRRGEKGIRILAPRPYSRPNPLTREEEQRIYFVTVPVFDASQLANLDEKPLPAFFTPLGDDQQALYARLVQVVSEDGIAVREEATGKAQGYSVGGQIAISEGLDSRNKVLTLIHEYAHELLHWAEDGKQQSRQVKECHAEAVAYIVAHYLGIHNPFSADYLQHWGNTPAQLLAELDTVRRTAARIIERLEPRASPEREEPDPTG